MPYAPMPGSPTATACVKRPSEESSTSVLEGWGTLSGTPNAGTETSPSSVNVGIEPADPSSRYRRSAAIESGLIATTDPLPEPPKMLAGSGVKTLLGREKWVSVKLLAAGQVLEPKAGLARANTEDPLNPPEPKSFVPMIMNASSPPSLP